MLNISVSFAVYLIEMLIAYTVFSQVGERKLPIIMVFLTGAAIFSSGAVINLLFANTVWINITYTLVINCVFAVTCFKIKFKAAIAYAIIMDLLSLAFELITIFIITALSSSNVTEFNTNFSTLVVEVSISKILYFTVSVLLLRLPQKTTGLFNNIPRNFFLFPACTLVALVSFWHISNSQQLSQTNQLLLSISSIVLLVATVTMFIIYKLNTEKEADYIRVKRENDRLITEKCYYDILDHQNQQLMIYAHDAQNHLTVIRCLNKDPNIDEYIVKLTDTLNSYSSTCHSGNTALDVIINKYVTECEMRDIRFEYDVKLCNLKEVDNIDLVAILGNLMDNALTAAGKSEKHILSLETGFRNNYYIINIFNSCDTPPISDGDSLVTTKSDRQLHGFGLKSVKKTLRKYHGDMYWNYNEDTHTFETTVMLKSNNLQ